MTKPNHTGVLKLVIMIVTVLLAHSGAFSESARLWYVAPSIYSDSKSSPAFPGSKNQVSEVLQIKCPENISTYTDINECSADISNIQHVQVLNGTLAKLTWTMEGATEATSLPSGINQIDHHVFNKGVTIVRCYGSDSEGNTSECSFTVVVSDNQAPKMSAPKSISVNCDERIPSPHTTLQAFLNAGGKASDNCNLNPATFKLESEHKSNSGCPFTLTRTYQISDWQGNITKVKQSISVEEINDEVTSEEIRVLTLKSGMGVITSTATGGDWSNGTSWAGGVAPLPGDDVIILNGATISLTGNQICNDITINGTLNCGANTLQVNGSWTNNGTFNAGTGTVEFAGNSNAVLSGSSTTVFKNFVIKKGTVSNILEINKNIQLGGVITFTSGLMQINNGVTVNCTFNTGFTIEEYAGIFVDGGNFTTGAFSVNNNGLFRIDSGTATIGSSNGNSFVVNSKGTFDINGGTVNVAGRLEVSGGTVDIWGGTINLNTVSQNSSTIGSLDLSLSSKFIMSGGTINFLNPNGTGYFDVIMLNGVGGSKTFTGGIFNFGDGTTDTYKISSAVPFPDITSAANTNLEYKLLLTSTGTFNFPLADNSGNAIPAAVQISGGTLSPGAFIEIKTKASKYSENKSFTNFLNRYWTVSTNGITNPVYNITATYADADISGTESEIAMGSWSGSLPWVKYGNVNASSNIVAATGITATSLVFAGITSDPPPVIISTANSSICIGNFTTITVNNDIVDPTLTYLWTSNPVGYTSGSQDITVSPTATTTYTAIVTDGNGFTASDDIIITVIPDNTITLNSGNNIQTECINSAITNITYTSTGASGASFTGLPGGVSGNYLNGNITISGTPTASGTYNYTVTLTGGCGTVQSTGTITVTPNNTIDLTSGNNIQTKCINTAIADITYTSTGSTGATFSGLPAGVVGNYLAGNITISGTPTVSGTFNYTVTLTDGCGNIFGNGTITVTPENTITLSSAEESDAQQACINRQIAQITYTTTGATGATVTGLPTGVTGSWNANKVTISGTATSVGIFNYSVTLTGGCGNITENGTITVNPKNSMTLTSAPETNVQTICINTSIADITYSTTGAEDATFTNLPPGVSGVWNDDVITISGIPTVSGIFDYTVALTGGCSTDEITKRITVTPPITAIPSITDPIKCFGGTATIKITASGGSPPYTYNFQGKPSNTTGIFTFVTGTEAGTDYNWSVTDSKNCAAFTGTTTVTQPPQLSADAEVSTPINCTGGTGTVTLTANGGTSPYSFTFNGQTNTTGIFTNVVAGANIPWSVKDANNCSTSTANLTIDQPAPISIISATVTTPISCFGGTGSVTIVGSGGTGQLSYTFNGETNNSGVFSGVYSGNNLSFSITDANGCSPKFGTISVPQPAALSASAVASSATCFGSSTGSINLSVTGGTAPFSFLWNNGAGTDEDPANLAAGTYAVTITDFNGCTATASATITQPNLLTASVTETTSIICDGGTATIKITVAGGTGTKTYSFQGQPDNTTGIFAGITGAVSPGTPYNWSVSDGNGCVFSDTYNVIQPEQIVPGNTTSNSPICIGTTLNLTTANATGGTPPYRYSWSGPNGFTANNTQNPTMLNATSAASGTYILTVTDANNCIKTTATDVTVHTATTMDDPANQSVCHNTLTNAIIFTGATSYTWTNNNTSIGLAASSGGPVTGIDAFVATNNTEAPVTATITVTPTANGCPGTPQTFTITVNPIPVVEITNNTPFLCDNGVSNIVLGSPVSGTTFSWSGTDGSSGNGTLIQQPLSGSVTYTIIPTANVCEGEPQTTEIIMISSDYELETNTAGPNGTVFCSGELFQIEFEGASPGKGGNDIPFIGTHWEWETRFSWSVSNPNVQLQSIVQDIIMPDGSLSFNLVNNTNEDQTVVVTLTPWAYYRQRNCFFYYCGEWDPDWEARCSGESYSTTITVHSFRAECPSDYEVYNDPGTCTSTFTPDMPTFECSPLSVNWSMSDGSSGTGNIGSHSFNAGVTNVNFEAADVQGNIVNCSYTVTVTDNQPPVINDCPGNTDTPMTAGECGAIVNFTAPAATDNCEGSVSLVRTDGTGLNSGSIFPVGETTISYLATDAAGNTSTCSFTITVLPDDQPPVISCVSTPQSVCATAGNPYLKTGVDWDASVTENCAGAVTKTYTLTGATLGTGTSLNNVEFGVGTTKVTWTATDNNSNISTCEFDVVVTQAPSITTNPVSQSTCLNGSATFTVDATGTPLPTFQWRKDGFDIPGATGSSVTINPVLATDAGSYDVVVTNDCGSVTSTPVALTTSTLPVITLQPANQTDCFDQSVEFTTAATNGETPYFYFWEMRKTSADAWVSTGGNNSTLLVSNIGTGNNISGAEYRVTITDACGNATAPSSTATLTVNQMELKPFLSETVCQGGITSFTEATLGSSPVGYVWQLNGFPISNGGAYNGTTAQTLTISNAQLAQNGTYSVSAIFNITQPNNNGAGVTTCQTEFISVGELIVEEGPDIVASLSSQSICSGTAITEIVLSNANETPETTYSWTRDNTTVLIGIPATGEGNSINGVLTSLDPTNSHTTIFTVTSSTQNGCISTTQVSVTVEDNETPTINFCPGDFTVSTGAGICGALVNYTAPTFNDNCDGNGLDGTLISGPASGDEFSPGPTTVTWEYTDGAGNGPVTCSFTVTVNDDVDPTALCQNITVQLDATGNAAITAAQIDAGSSDPCGEVTLSVDKTTFDCDNVGNNTVILTVEDVNGNTATCTATVTVEDNIEPTAVCKDITVQLDASGNATIAAVDIDNESGDNCGTVTLTAAPTTFTCANVGDNTVVLTVTDENGGTKTCNAIVTVEDNIAPTVLCKDFTVQLDGSGNATITVNDIDNGSTDNCAIATRILSKTDFTCADAVTNNVTLTVTDVNGNAESCTAIVTIEDNENPVANCQNITVQLDAAGNATITAADIDNGSTDNCGSPALTIDKTTFDCTNIGPNTVTLTVTDESGNSQPCAAIVTVKDDNFPVTISATPSQTSIDCYGGSATVTITVSGGVGILSYTFNGVSNSSGIFNNIFAGTYNWSVTNALGCGNTSGSFDVQQAGDLSAIVALTDVTCSSGADGTITVTNSSGGSGNYEYSNNGGISWQSSNIFSGLIPGSYNVQIRDAAVPTCLKILDANVVIFTLTANVAYTNIDCNSTNNGTITVTSPFGGSGTYNYSINGGANWSPNGTFTNLAPDTYNVQIQDANDETCIVELNNAVVITEPDLLAADVSLTQISCFGANDGTITVSNPAGGFGTYEVSINGSSWYTISASTPHTFNNLSPASYTVMIRDAAVTSCIVNLASTIINQPQVLSATVNYSNVTCYGFNDGIINVSAPLGGNGIYQVSINGTDWFDVSSVVPYAFNGLTPGTYTVQIRDAGQTSCSVTITPDIIITEPPLVTVNDPGPQDFCNVASTPPINLSGSPGGVVFDITGGTGIGLADQIGVSQIPSFPTIPGSAIVTITPRANGCTGTSVDVIITVSPIPTANMPVDVIFCNNVLSDPFPLTGTPANVVFDITGGASIGLPNATNVTEIPPFMPVTGTATVTITPKVGNYCTGTPVSFPITVRPTLTASISGGGAIVCRNSVPPTITFNNPMALPVEILYNINGGADLSINVEANSSFPIFTPTNVAGTFNYNLVGVKYQTKPDCFFNVTGLAVVTVLETPLASISGTNIVCQDAASPLLTFTNPINSLVRVTYNVNGLNPATIDVPALSSATFSAPTSGAGTFVYNLVSAEFPDNPTCSNIITGSATITVLPKPTVTIAGESTVCKNASGVNVTITNPQILPVRITYTVNNGAPVTANIGAGLSAVISVNTANPGSFSYKVTSVQYIAPSPDCINNVDISATVVVLTPPTASISGNATVCLNDVQPVITFTNPQAIPVTITYNINGAIQPPVDVLANSTATVSAPTSTAGVFVYNLVSIVYQGSNSCTNNITGSATITVRPVPTVSISGDATDCQFASPSPNVTLTNSQNLPITVTYRRNGINQTPVNVPASSSIQIPVSTATLVNYLYELISVQYQNAPNCPNTATGSVTVNILAAPTVTVTGTTTVCPNDAEPVITFLNPQALPITVTYNINGTIQPVLNIGAVGTATISAPTSTSGIFNYNVVSVEYQGGAACANTTSGAFATVTVKTAPATPVAGNNGPVCVGSPLSLTANTIAGATYSWTGPNGFTSSLQNPTVSANATSVMAGIYSVVATVNGCTGPAGTTTVTVVDIPAAPTAGNNGPVCAGSALSLTASNIAGATYNWTGPNGFTSNLQNPTVSANATAAMAGTYTVSVVVNGCVGTPATTDVLVKPVPVIPNQIITSCNASAFVVSPQNGVPAGTVVPVGTTYSWTAPVGTGFTGGSAQTNQTSISQTLTLTNANVGATATYTVTPNANGCNGVPFTVTVNIDPIPFETNVMYFLWPTGGYDSEWDLYNEWSQCAAQSDLYSGHNDLDVVVKIGGVWQRPTSTTFDNFDDFGWQYSFESNTGPWDNLPPVSPPLFQYFMPPAPSDFTRLGDHYFRFFVTKNGCTTYSDIIVMHMISNFNLIAGESPDVDCSNNPVPIQLTGASVSGTGPSPGNIIARGKWSIVDLEPDNANMGTLSSNNYELFPGNVSYTPPANYAGTVTLKLETNDPDGNGECSSIFDFRTITISPVAGANAGNPMIVCAGNPVQLNGSVYGTATGGSWSVSPVGTGTFSDVNSLSSTYTPPVNFNGTITLTLTPNVPGSCIETSSVDITVNTAPQTSSVDICEGGSGSFTLLSACPSGGSFTLGPNNASLGVNTSGIGTSSWSNPVRAVSNNNSYATVSLSASGVTTSNYLRTTNYGFSIPVNATITGITVTIRRYESSTGSGADVRDVQVRLLRNGVLVGDNKANTTLDWPTSETAANYGGSSDLWGTTWTAADINNNNFGVSLVANSDNNRTASVDFMGISVTYAIAGEINWYSSSNAVTPIGTGSPFNPVGVANSGLPNTNTPGTTTFYGECTTYPGCRTPVEFVINPKPTVTKPNDLPVSACDFADQAALDAAFNNWLSEFSVSGGAAPEGSFVGTPTAPSLCTGGTVTAVYNYTDDCETSFVSAIFTVTPPPELIINNPGDAVSFSCDYINQAAVQTAFTNWLAGFTSTGGCAPVVTFTDGIPAAPPICGGSVTVTYNVSDLCENGTETAIFTISGTASVVLDKPNPKVASSCDFTDQLAVDADFANWLTDFTVVSGGCAGSASFGFPVAPALCTGGTTEVTYLYQDVCATVSVTQTYTINAPAEIAINKPVNFNENICDFADQAAVDAAFASWLTGFSATGGCGGGTGTFSTTTAPALCGSGTVDVTYTYTDNCQSKSETASFTLDNTNSLVINKPANVDDEACYYGSQEDLNTFFADWLTGFNISGGCGASGTYGTPSAPDLCAGGTTTVTYTVTDNCGNIFTENATFKINIQGDLTFVKPIPFTAAPCNYANQNELNLAFQNWLTGFGVSGGCSPVGSYGNPVAPNLCEGGTVTVTYQAIDVCLTSSVSQTFTVEAVEPIQAVQMQEHFAPACLSQTEMDAEFAAWISTFAYTGGCNVHPPSLEAFTAPPACGGSVIVNYTFYDDCGQTATGSAVFTVEPDEEDPVVTCPADFTGVLIDNGSCMATLELIPPTATDNCSAFGAITFTNNAPAQFPVGTTIVIWTATDICGNSSTCEQSITVLDNDEAPVITNCPEDAVDVIIGTGCSMITGEITEPTITDNCPNPVLHYDIVYPDGSTASGINSVSGLPFPVGVSTVTYIAIDDAGNPSLPCTFTVWIKDLVPPEFEVTCPIISITVNAAAGVCNAFVNVPGPSVSDPCDELVTLTHNSVFSTNTTNADGTYPVGTTTIIWTATDLSGNTTTCEQDIIVRDVTAPEITCPGEVSGFVNIDDCIATGVDLGTPTATDDCSAPVTFTNDAPAVFPVGNTTVTWTATDAAGNSANCTQIVSITDANQPPVFTLCPPNQEQTTTANNCELIDIVIPDPEYDDNCGVTVLTWAIKDPDGTIRNSNPTGINYVTGETFYVGVSTVTYIAYDAAGNPSEPCTFTVWIKDFVKPEFTAGCPPNVGPVPTDAGVCTAFISIPVPLVNDPCGEGYTLTNNYTGDYKFPIGVTIITWTIVDASGNITTCDQEIEVIESQILAVDCPADIVRSVAPGDDFVSGIVVGNPTIHLGCFDSELTWVMVPPVGYESMYTPAQLSGNGIFVGTGTYYLGVTTVTYTLTDTNGSTATCDFTVTITTAPEIQCAADQTFDADENCEYPFDPGVPTLIQGIPPIDWTWTLTNPDGTTSTGGSRTPDDGLVPLPVVAAAPHEYPFQIGVTTIDWTATNIYGTGTCRQTITVVDNQPPTFTADGFEGCVENLMEVTYTGVSDILVFNIDYKDHDYYIMRIGSDILDIDMTSYSDNCCFPTDDSGIRWEIDFEGTAANEPSITGTGQPSDYGSVIYLWGDGVNFQPRTHKITYWITDCHGTESDPVPADIIINPRPKVGKL